MINAMVAWCDVLYDEKDLGINILYDTNFDNFVKNKSKVSLIEFYHSWCGHCIRFAPNWKAFAKDINKWSPVVGVGVVDCSEDKNTQLCREYNVRAYPSLLFLQPGFSLKAHQSIDLRFTTQSNMRKQLIELLIKEEKLNRHSNWPNLRLFKPSHYDDLMQSIDKNKVNLLIVQESDSVLGAEVNDDLKIVFFDSIFLIYFL